MRVLINYKLLFSKLSVLLTKSDELFGVRISLVVIVTLRLR